MGAPYTAHGFRWNDQIANEAAYQRPYDIHDDIYCWTPWTNRAFTGSCTRKKSFTVTVLDSAHRFWSCLA